MAPLQPSSNAFHSKVFIGTWPGACGVVSAQPLADCGRPIIAIT
jgi:hypothetical protein